MDELELLKKNWQDTDPQFETFSDNDIYKMSHKKSSSIVKTLFHISIAELVFWILVNILPFVLSDEMKVRVEEMSHSFIYLGLNILSYIIILLFIYLLWQSQKSISVTDNAKKLMESIINTRKIIKYYVLYNLGFALLSIPITLYFTIKEHPELAERFSNASAQGLIVFFIVITLATAAFIGVFWLIYRLIYGILIKRLNTNYEELKRLEE